MRAVELRPAAAADIEEAASYYERQRAGLGLEFLEALSLVKADIADQPERFPVVVRDTRRAMLKRFPYSLYFRLMEDRVLVVACMHGRRSPKRWGSRR